MDPSDEAEPTTPTPKRYLWLKRLSLAALVLIVLLVGLRLIWGQRIQSRLDETIADIQAKGEPILFEDLQSEPINDADNGAWHLMQALQNWPSIPGQPGMNIHDTDWYIEGEEAGYTDPITDNTAYLDSCKPVLDTIRKAVAMDQARWLSGPLPADYTSFNKNAFNHLGDTRRLARLMHDASLRAFQNDNAALGVEILHLIGQHGDQVARQRLSVIDALVAISIYAIVYENVGKHLPQLSDEQVQNPATRQALIALRDWLIDEAYSREAFIQTLIANRWGTHQYVLGIRDGSIPTNPWLGSGLGRLIIDTPGLSHTLFPLLVKAHAEVLSLDTEGIDAFKTTDNLRDSAGDPNKPTFEEIYEARPWLYPMFEELSYSDAAFRTYYRQLARRRMAATAIAIRLYQADHGQRPGSLNELVPEYLAKIPADPFVGDRPIGYKPQGVVPKTAYELGREFTVPIPDEVRAALPNQPLPLLYCVGHDYQDNGGALLLNEYDGTIEWYNGGEEGEDSWYLLVPEPEPVQALIDLNDREFVESFDIGPEPSKGGEDEVEKEYDPRDEAEDQQPQPQPDQGQ